MLTFTESFRRLFGFILLRVKRPVALQGTAKKLLPLTPEQTARMTKMIDVLLAKKHWLEGGRKIGG